MVTVIPKTDRAGVKNGEENSLHTTAGVPLLKKIQARGKRRAQMEGMCSQCGRELPHTIATIEPRPLDEKQAALEEVMLAFPEAPPKKPVRRMAPERVIELRSVGCRVPEYPETGTPEWMEFVRGFKQELAAKLDNRSKAPNLRKGRGKKKLFVAEGVEARP